MGHSPFLIAATQSLLNRGDTVAFESRIENVRLCKIAPATDVEQLPLAVILSVAKNLTSYNQIPHYIRNDNSFAGEDACVLFAVVLSYIGLDGAPAALPHAAPPNGNGNDNDAVSPW